MPISLSNAYLFKFHLMQIVPTPEASADGDLTVFWFTTLTSDQPTTIQFRIEPESIGKIDGEIVIKGTFLDFGGHHKARREIDVSSALPQHIQHG